MQLRKSLLSVALGLAALASTAASLSAAAQELIVPPTNVDVPLPVTGNGGLVAYAYSPTASLVVYLGLNLDSFLAPAASPEAGRSIDFGVLGGALWTSTFGADASNVRWSVTAGDVTNTSGGTGAGTHLGRRLATTAVEGTDTSTLNANMTNAINNANQFLGFVNDNANCSASSPCAVTDSGSLAWSGRLGDTMGPPLDPGTPQLSFTNTNLVSGVGSTANSMQFFLLSGGGTGAGTGSTTSALYQNATTFGLWNLTANGVLTWNQAGATTVVPLPAAVWLLLSGIAGIGVVGRRRASAAAAA